MGGGTNITRSNENVRGGIKINLKRNFNKVISFSAIDQTVTVMAGITGPQLEEILNNANEYFTNVTGRYTLGHIPESFEFSTAFYSNKRLQKLPQNEYTICQLLCDYKLQSPFLLQHNQ